MGVITVFKVKHTRHGIRFFRATYPPERILKRRIGRWIRRFEKKHGDRSVFRLKENRLKF